jgi:hypothetical protein
MSVGEDSGEKTGRRGRSWRDVDLRAVAPFAALVLLLIVGALVNPNFIGMTNLTNVATRCAFIAIIAVGATFVISAGDLDLSVGAMVAFVASLMILFMNSGVIADPSLMLAAAVLFSIIAGVLCGLANGLITTMGKIEPFIATLGTMGVYRGLTTWLSQGGAITLRPANLQALYKPAYYGSVLGVPVPIVVILVVTCVAAFILYRLRYPGSVCRDCRASLRATAWLHLGNDGYPLGVAGDHRRRRGRHGAEGRCGQGVGYDLRRLHPRAGRQYHAAFQFHQRVSAECHSGRDHHHRHAGSALACSQIMNNRVKGRPVIRTRPCFYLGG